MWGCGGGSVWGCGGGSVWGCGGGSVWGCGGGSVWDCSGLQFTNVLHCVTSVCHQIWSHCLSHVSAELMTTLPRVRWYIVGHVLNPASDKIGMSALP